jgi:hypothetical protein
VASIGDIIMRMLLDGSDFQAQAKKEGAKAGDAAGAAMSRNINNTLGGQLGKGIAQGLGIAGALGAANVASSAVGGVVDLIDSSIDAASSLNETVSKGRVIFGDSADEIEAWAATAADSFGQSKRQALDTASGFAGLFDTVGIDLDKAIDMSKQLTVLGSDLASFFDTDVATALGAIRSGLSGESEPLRRFNVFLSETAVSAKLAQLGVKKVGGQFTESQKATARYLLILEQTSAAQGDFARTSDSLANSQRSVDAALEDTQAQLGQEFLPIAKQVTEWQLDFLRGLGVVGSALDEFGGGLTDVQNNINGLIDSATPWDTAMEQARKAAKDTTIVADRWWQDEIPAAIEGGKSNIDAAAAEAVSGIPAAMDKIKPEVRKSAKEIAGDVADAIRSERQTIDSLIDELNERRTQPPISLTKEVEGLISTLLSPQLAQDLVSPDPLTRAIARELKESIEERLGEIKLRPGVMADRVKEMLERANTATNPVTKDLAKDIGDLYVDSLIATIGGSGNQRRVNAAIRALFDNVPDFVFNEVSGTLIPGKKVAPGGRPLASGMPFVPFDNMPALLHRGEAVLTAEENAARLGGSRGVNVNIERVDITDAHDEFSLTQSLQFLAAVG